MPDPTLVKHALARLADGPPDDPPVPDVVVTARRARTDLDAAADFVVSGGLGRLRRAVERTGDGTEELAAFERYRDTCQFHPGHATDIPAGPKDTSH